MSRKVVQLSSYRDDILPLTTRFWSVEEKQETSPEVIQQETLSVKDRVLAVIKGLLRQPEVLTVPIYQEQTPIKDAADNILSFPKSPNFTQMIDNFMSPKESHFSKLCQLVVWLQNNPHIIKHAENDRNLKNYIQETFNEYILYLNHDRLAALYHEMSHVALTSKISLFVDLRDTCHAYLVNSSQEARALHTNSRSVVK